MRSLRPRAPARTPLRRTPSSLDDLLGVSSTSMDVDPSSVNGKTELNSYMRVQQLSTTRATRTLSCSGSSTSKSSHTWTTWSDSTCLFLPILHLLRDSSAVGLVKSDLRGRLLDTILIDVTQCGLNNHPTLNLKESKRKSTITHTHPDKHTLS